MHHRQNSRVVGVPSEPAVAPRSYGREPRSQTRDTGAPSPFVTMVSMPAGVRLTWGKTFISGTSPSSILTTEVSEIRWQVLKDSSFQILTQRRSQSLGVQVEHQTRRAEIGHGICCLDRHLGGRGTIR